MKKRWIPFIALALVVIFVGGILLGSATWAEQQPELWVARINVQTTIAVVNSDVGVESEGGNRLNYSAAIISALEEEFVQASPALAETGFLDGTFGAVITFPYHVSKRVLSFNDREPQRIQLEFMINPYLSEQEYVETYLRILNLQMAINSTLAHTYVSSIFGQLHGAQNQVTDILQNKERDLTAMEIIALEQFTPSLNLEYVPDLPFDPESFDGEGFFISKEGFANAVATLYLESYREASSSFLTMREGVFTMTEVIPEQATGWLLELEEWAQEWEEFGKELEAYKEFAVDVIDELNQLLEDLGEYLDDAEELVEIADDFWLELDVWHDELYASFSQLEGLFATFETDIDGINQNIGLKEDYRYYLDGWHGDLYGRYVAVDGWSVASNWHSVMVDRKIAAQDQIADTIDARPVRGDFGPDEEPDYQDAVGEWLRVVVSVTASVLGDLGSYLTHMGNQIGSSLPGGIFNNLRGFTYEGELPSESAQLSTAGQMISELNEVELPYRLEESHPYFDGEPPDPIEPFEEQVPEEIAPESVEGFLDPLDGLRGQIETFDTEAYLTEALWQQVEGMIGGVGSYLDSVGGELGGHIESNYMLLSIIYLEYVNYLSRLRQSALDAEASEMANLRERLDEFYQIHDVTRLDTIARLIDFSGMMPESRTEEGVNLGLVNHTITPFEFTPPVLREGVSLERFEGESLYDRFGRLFWIAMALAALVFLVTLASHLVSAWRNRKLKVGNQ